MAIVVLPEDVTSARTLSAGFAGLMTALAFSAGVGVQPLARRLGNPLTGVVAGLCCAAAGAGVGVAAVAGADEALAGVAAVLLGMAYGLCLVSGLRQARADRAPDPPVLCQAGTTGTRTLSGPAGPPNERPCRSAGTDGRAARRPRSPRPGANCPW